MDNNTKNNYSVLVSVALVGAAKVIIVVGPLFAGQLLSASSGWREIKQASTKAQSWVKNKTVQIQRSCASAQQMVASKFAPHERKNMQEMQRVVPAQEQASVVCGMPEQHTTTSVTNHDSGHGVFSAVEISARAQERPISSRTSSECVIENPYLKAQIIKVFNNPDGTRDVLAWIFVDTVSIYETVKDNDLLTHKITINGKDAVLVWYTVTAGQQVAPRRDTQFRYVTFMGEITGDDNEKYWKNSFDTYKVTANLYGNNFIEHIIADSANINHLFLKIKHYVDDEKNAQAKAGSELNTRGIISPLLLHVVSILPYEFNKSISFATGDKQVIDFTTSALPAEYVAPTTPSSIAVKEGLRDRFNRARNSARRFIGAFGAQKNNDSNDASDMQEKRLDQMGELR